MWNFFPNVFFNNLIYFTANVNHFSNIFNELFDIDSINNDILFDSNFKHLSKENKLKYLNSYPNHAMILAGVDIENDKIIKWKIGNSWGEIRDVSEGNPLDIAGYFTMSHDWFKEYVFTIIIEKKYLNGISMRRYDQEIKTPIILPLHDIIL